MIFFQHISRSPSPPFASSPFPSFANGGLGGISFNWIEGQGSINLLRPRFCQGRSGARHHSIALLLLACSSHALADGAIHSISQTPQRDFGIVMGETLSSEIRVAVAPGLTLETATLPQAGSALNDVLEVRESSWREQAKPDETVYTIKLTYQVFKGVREAETVEVPALALRFSQAAETVEAQVPGWTFTLMPLIPPWASDADVQVRGDLPPPVYSAEGHWRWLAAFLLGLAGLGVYAAWQLGLPPFRFNASPFARAVSGLKKLRKRTGLERWRQGLRLVHAALNETAGRVLCSSQLADFLAQQPQYAGLRPELERFFALSDRLFFAGGTEPPVDYPWTRLEALCRQLAAAGQSR